MSTVTQRLSIAYTGTVALLRYYLTQLSSDIEQLEKADKPTLRIFKSVNLVIEPKMVVIEVGSIVNHIQVCSII
jgi:hypothetical protein